ncbi:MAG: hypothetical protein HKN28_16485 [Alphaproteobacteria bacterium]|nr:hypothetical protein [Alphaproteobacteria bacterium]
MRTPMRTPIPALLAMLFLSGCAVPPAVAVASLAANGVSFAATGKSTTDHAISAVAGEDCALLRVASEKPVCDPNGEVLVALEVTETPDADWYVDLETGGSTSAGLSTANAPITLFAKGAATPARRTPASPALNAALDRLSARDATLNPGSVSGLALSTAGEDDKQLASLIALAAAPELRGDFIEARPAPKPETPPLPARFEAQEPLMQEPPPPKTSGAWYSRLTARTRGIFAKPDRQ